MFYIFYQRWGTKFTSISYFWIGYLFTKSAELSNYIIILEYIKTFRGEVRIMYQA